ncbi:PTS mannose transporter subunit IIA [Pediococcus acidilactici]
MEKKIIVASHGQMASGILSSLKIIYGESDQVEALDCYVEKDFDLSQKIAALMNKYANYELIVITDIFGGSVNNEFLTYLKRKNFYLVAGLNLPLLIELVSGLNTSEPTEEWVRKTLHASKKNIQFCNGLLEKSVKEETF